MDSTLRLQLLCCYLVTQTASTLMQVELLHDEKGTPQTRLMVNAQKAALSQAVGLMYSRLGISDEDFTMLDELQPQRTDMALTLDGVATAREVLTKHTAELDQILAELRERGVL